MAGPMGGGRRHGPHGPVKKPKNMKGTIKRLFGYILKHKGLFFGMLIFAAISSTATVSASLFIKPIVDDYLTPMIGQEFTKELMAPLLKLMCFMGGVFLFGAFASYGHSKCSIWLT